MPVSDDCHTEAANYRQKYRNLKKKFRYLIYENECFQDELRKAQRKFLKVNQDKSFLLDRLLQYERIEESSSDSDVTLSSDSEIDNFALKKKKPSTSTSNSHHFAGIGTSNSTTARPHSATSEPAPKRKKPSAKSPKSGASSSSNVGSVPAVTIKTEPEESIVSSQGDGHMTSEEIERHLESRQILMDLVPERAPPTVPTEMFSNDVTCLERFMMADDD